MFKLNKKPKDQETKKTNGFTLVEVLVAMLVLAIGLLGLAGMTVVVLRSNILSQQISEATTITGDLMETLKRVNYTDLRQRNCYADTTNQSNIISISTSCPILEESGIENEGIDFMPADPGSSDYQNYCVVTTSGGDGIVADHTDGSAATYDQISANLISTSLPGSSTSDFCDGFPNLPWGQYIRYYRAYDPDSAAVGGDDEVRLVVVVLWKDRFGKWRNINLRTSRVQ